MPTNSKRGDKIDRIFGNKDNSRQMRLSYFKQKKITDFSKGD